MLFDISIVQSLGKIAVAILLLLSFFLVTVKSRIKTANRIFAGFLILVAFDMCGLFIYEWLEQHPVIDMIRRSSVLLQMPLFYFYLRVICFKGIHVRFALLKHTILFFAFWLTLFIEYVWLPVDQKIAFNQNLNTAHWITFSILAEIQYFVYIFLMFRSLSVYKTNYQANYANYDSTAYRWLFQLTCISLVAHFFALSKNLVIHFASPGIILPAYFVVSISALSAFCWLVLKALYHPSITRGIKTDTTLETLAYNDAAVRFGLKKNSKRQEVELEIDDLIRDQIDHLQKFMVEHEPYLDPDLHVEKLALLLHMPVKELSTLINQYMRQNFFNFVNGYRIEKAKLLLSEQQNSKRTVLQILYDVGFNSKSSFNTAFKKHTGQTPTSFRKTCVLTEQSSNLTAD